MADYVQGIVLEMPLRIPSQQRVSVLLGQGEALVERDAQEQNDPRWDALKKIEFS